MIVSKNLITKFLPEFKKVSDNEFINACNAIGIEVEKIINHPKLDNFIIGQIIQIDKHPNADRLHVCKIKIDQTDQYLTIVCGGKNLELNKKVIIAQDNTTLYDGKIIKHSELRGVLSQGMICSYVELTPHHNFFPKNEDHYVITLDEAQIGDTEIAKYVGLDDVIYDLSLPGNRNDLNSVYVLCKELCGYFKYEFEMPTINDINEINSSAVELNFDKNIVNTVAFLKINNVSPVSSS
jgi:phenylalanyl-tRNA synthetase beta chain